MIELKELRVGMEVETQTPTGTWQEVRICKIIPKDGTDQPMVWVGAVWPKYDGQFGGGTYSEVPRTLGELRMKGGAVILNDHGQIQCHRCGIYSDLIFPVHLRNQHGSWVSLLCHRCQDGPPGSQVVRIGDPVDKNTYDETKGGNDDRTQ